jgi:hypothetical protein
MQHCIEHRLDSISYNPARLDLGVNFIIPIHPERVQLSTPEGKENSRHTFGKSCGKIELTEFQYAFTLG